MKNDEGIQMNTQYELLKHSEIIKNAFTRWESYREYVTEYVLEHVESDRMKVVGAGVSNDLDLACLAKYLNSIILLDRREQDCKEAFLKYHLQDKQTVVFQQSSFWNITDQEFAEFESLVCNVTKQTYMEQAVLDYMEQLGRKLSAAAKNDKSCENDNSLGAFHRHVLTKKEQTGNQNSTYCMIGLHSQLNIMFVQLAKAYLKENNDNVMQAICQKVRQLNELAAESCIHWLKHCGCETFVMGFEMAVAYTETDKGLFQLFIQQYDRETDSDKKHELETCMRKNIEDKRVEGAYQMLQTIEQCEKEKIVTLSDTQYTIWPFSEEKEYLMCLITCKFC